MWTERLEERDRVLQMIRDRLANQSSEPAGEFAQLNLSSEVPNSHLRSSACAHVVTAQADSIAG